MKNILFYTLILLLCYSCDNRSHYDEIIANAEKVVAEYPDSALNILHTLEFPENFKDSTKANYWLAVGQAHNNAQKAMADDSLLLYSLQYYKEHSGNMQRLLQSYLLAAEHLKWIHKTKEAKGLLHEGLKLSEANNDNIHSSSFYKSLAKMSANEEELLDNMKKILALNRKLPTRYTFFHEIGVTYTNLGQKDSAKYYFEKGIELSLNNKDTAFAYFMQRNYASALNDLGEPREAIKLQRKVINYYNNKSFLYLSMSEYYLNLGMPDSAQYYMNMANRNRIKNGDNKKMDNYYITQEAVLHYAQHGVFNMHKIARYTDNIIFEFKDKEKEIVEQLNNKNRLEQCNLKLTIDKQKNQIIILFVILILIIVAGLLYYYIHKRKKVLEEKEEELETLKHLLKKAEKSKDNEEKDDKFFKRILLQQLGIIRLAATVPTTQNQEFLQQMIRITNKDIPVETLLVWEDLYQVIDSIYNNFYTNISSMYGNRLSDKEIQLCCLLKAEFSTKEISVVTQQSIQTIYQRKTTIRQKLQMNEKEDIPDFLTV